MVFSDSSFVLIFFPLVAVIYFLLNNSLQKIWLILTSFLFYYIGSGLYVVLLFLSCFINWLFGVVLETKRCARTVLIVGITVNLVPLIFFKYSFFLAENINALCSFWNIRSINVHRYILPIGISFYTFQGISYLVDIYRRDVEVIRNPINFFLYLSCFPQLIAGPIVRLKDIRPQLFQRKINVESICVGLSRFVWGLSKKVLIADPVSRIADMVFATPTDQLTCWTSWIGAIAFSIQIYFDFSGYSDMAIGLGRIFGFNFPENFRHPYSALTVTDFWRRWHITLSSWFRDYVYFPLGGSRKDSYSTIKNLWIVFLATGLWHGASWTFVLWGVTHGIYLTLERIFSLNDIPRTKILSVFLRFYTLFLVIIAWVLFRSPDIGHSINFYEKMFMPSTYANFGWTLDLVQVINLQNVMALLVGSFSFFAFSKCSLGKSLEQDSKKMVVFRLVLAACFLPIAIVEIVTQGFRPFLYFQF